MSAPETHPDLARLERQKMLFMIIGGVLLLPLAIYAPLRGEEGGVFDYVMVFLLVAALVGFGIAWRATKSQAMPRERLAK